MDPTLWMDIFRNKRGKKHFPPPKDTVFDYTIKHTGGFHSSQVGKIQPSPLQSTDNQCSSQRRHVAPPFACADPWTQVSKPVDQAPEVDKSTVYQAPEVDKPTVYQAPTSIRESAPPPTFPSPIPMSSTPPPACPPTPIPTSSTPPASHEATTRQPSQNNPKSPQTCKPAEPEASSVSRRLEAHRQLVKRNRQQFAFLRQELADLHRSRLPKLKVSHNDPVPVVGEAILPSQVLAEFDVRNKGFPPIHEFVHKCREFYKQKKPEDTPVTVVSPTARMITGFSHPPSKHKAVVDVVDLYTHPTEDMLPEPAKATVLEPPNEAATSDLYKLQVVGTRIVGVVDDVSSVLSDFDFGTNDDSAENESDSMKSGSSGSVDDPIRESFPQHEAEGSERVLDHDRRVLGHDERVLDHDERVLDHDERKPGNVQTPGAKDHPRAHDIDHRERKPDANNHHPGSPLDSHDELTIHIHGVCGFSAPVVGGCYCILTMDNAHKKTQVSGSSVLVGQTAQLHEIKFDTQAPFHLRLPATGEMLARFRIDVYRWEESPKDTQVGSIVVGLSCERQAEHAVPFVRQWLQLNHTTSREPLQLEVSCTVPGCNVRIVP